MIFYLFICMFIGFLSRITSLWLISIQKFQYNYSIVTCIWQKATWISISITYGLLWNNKKYLTTIIFYTLAFRGTLFGSTLMRKYSSSCGDRSSAEHQRDFKKNHHGPTISVNSHQLVCCLLWNYSTSLIVTN